MSTINLKVRTADNKVIVRSGVPTSNRVKVTTSQNIAKVTAVVAGPRGRDGADGSGGDKTYEQSFTNKSSVTVTHNLNKRPGVTVINSAHDVVKCPVNHINDNSLTVVFNGSFSGVVICN